MANKNKPLLLEEELFSSLEMELLNQAGKAKRGNRGMETYVLLWTVLEQFSLPNLIKYVAKKLDVVTPSNLSEMPASQSFKLYYFLSQDKELYDSLENCRKKRNKLIHSMHSHKDWAEIKSLFGDGPKDYLVPTMRLLINRYKDDTGIPVLNLYKNGWEAHKNETVELLDSILEN
jgi:hypothetical protein